MKTTTTTTTTTTTETKGEETMKTTTKTTSTTPKKARKGYNLRALWDAAESATARAEAGEALRISISGGNSKLGTIPSFSLLPGVTCSGTACAHCLREGCYAAKNALCHGYNPEHNNCLAAWARNTAVAKTDLSRLEAELMAYFGTMAAPRFFRIHVSGDFFSAEYAEMWRRVIKANPGTRFLFFTKQFDILRAVPFIGIDNCAPVLSGWTGCPVPDDLIRAGYRVAWCDDGQETRIPADAVECPGNCETCGMCWNLYRLQRDTYFHKH